MKNEARVSTGAAGASMWLSLAGAVLAVGCASSPPPPPAGPAAQAPSQPVVVAPPPAPPEPVKPPPAAWETKGRLALQHALACVSAGRGFAAAESELSKAGWRDGPAAAATPVLLPKDVSVFGLKVRAATVSRAEGTDVYRSHLGDATPLQVIKAARLKRGKDGVSYSRPGALGVLSLDSDKGEVTLTCTVKPRR